MGLKKIDDSRYLKVSPTELSYRAKKRMKRRLDFQFSNVNTWIKSGTMDKRGFGNLVVHMGMQITL